MKKIINFYKSEKKFLFFGYIFLFLGVYNVLAKNKTNYELLFIVAITQFLLYYIRIWFKNKTTKNNVA
jgi:membrane protein implicated in regulation of membrane protease activity|tara:strand:- start:167 stop:370 length:204 start_codon:yes stop_codon:yes gene_type:complete